MKFKLLSMAEALPIYNGLLSNYKVEWSYEVLYDYPASWNKGDEIEGVETTAIVEIESLEELVKLSQELGSFESEYALWSKPEIIIARPHKDEQLPRIYIYDYFNE